MIFNRLLASKESQQPQLSLRSGLACRSSRMRRISRRGLECVPATMRAQGRKRAAKRGEAIITSKQPRPRSAWAASRTKDTVFSAVYRNIAGRRGKKRALVAVGHLLLVEIYRVLKTGDRYQDAGAEAVNERRSKNREQRLIRELKRCGYEVSKVGA